MELCFYHISTCLVQSTTLYLIRWKINFRLRYLFSWDMGTPNTARFASNFDPHLKIDSEVQLKMKLKDKKRWFQFPPSEYSIYMWQHSNNTCIWSILISVDTVFQSWFLWGLLLTRKILSQGFLLVKLKSSLQKFYGCHHDLVDHYFVEYLSQITTCSICPFLIHDLPTDLRGCYGCNRKVVGFTTTIAYRH